MSMQMDRSSRRNFMKTACLGVVAAAVPEFLNGTVHADDTSAGKPNIVLILADDLGYGDVSCYYPEGRIKTPNIDSLASSGVRFSDAHTNAAQCSPTRYGVLTGRYAWRTSLKKGVVGSLAKPLIENERMTIASLLKNNGYDTACIGKWHVGLDWPIREGKAPLDESGKRNPWALVEWNKPLKAGPLNLGFDYFFGLAGSNNMAPHCYIENDRVVKPPIKPKAYYYETEAHTPVSEDFRSEQIDQVEWKKARAWLGRHFAESPEQPFFLYYPTSAIHVPCLASEGFRGKSGSGLRGDKTLELDDIVGRLLDEIKKYGQEENTIIIFTSDNGAMPGDGRGRLENYAKSEHCKPYHPDQLLKRKGEGEIEGGWLTYGHKSNGPYLGYKTTIFEGGHRVPFIVRWPGVVKTGTVSDQLICTTDILATLADIVGDKLPDDAGEDSYSFLPVLKRRKGAKALREAVVLDCWYGMKAIRQGLWKLILGGGSGGFFSKKIEEHKPGQLYNIDDDPYETKNVYNENPDVVKQLTKLLDKYQRQGRSAPRQ